MMTPEFEQNLEKYAEVIVKVGLNLQPGQRLLIGAPLFDMEAAPIEAAPLVRLVAAQAYRAGARLVDVMWRDDQLKLVRLQHASPDSLQEYPTRQVTATLEYLRRKDAVLVFDANNPDLLQGQDGRLLGIIEQVAARSTAPILELIFANETNSTCIAAPVPGWAAKVFPDVAPKERDARLWDALFEICRVKEPDPVGAWQAHLGELAGRSAYLSQKQFAALKLAGPGTDLTIGLATGHLWRSAQVANAAGIPFTMNIPTEEIGTAPHRDRTEGVVTSTKPLSFGGGLIERFNLTFSQGRAVEVTAREGQESLRRVLETDAGACRLGEVALVPHSSPISRFGRTFYNILIDENASSHIALGRAYRFCLDKGETLSDEEFAAAGANLSSTHLDFMIGSGEMDVDGVRADGVSEPVMRGGEWAFEV